MINEPHSGYAYKGNALADTGLARSGNFEKATRALATFAPAYNNWGVVLANTGDDAGAMETSRRQSLTPHLPRRTTTGALCLPTQATMLARLRSTKATELNPQDAPVQQLGQRACQHRPMAGAIESTATPAGTGQPRGASANIFPVLARVKATELNPQDAVTYRKGRCACQHRRRCWRD